jgi:uncharacterized Zn finger protein
MVEPAGSLGQLIASFQLRRRAAPEAFQHGVRLANVGAVDILVESDRHLRAEVLDASLETVTLRVEDGALAGDCSCLRGASGICRHQVAAAHALWNRPGAD